MLFIYKTRITLPYFLHYRHREKPSRKNKRAVAYGCSIDTRPYFYGQQNIYLSAIDTLYAVAACTGKKKDHAEVSITPSMVITLSLIHISEPTRH